jgi:hypothetical protein
VAGIYGLKLCLAPNPAPDIANDAAQQHAQFLTVAIELFGMGVAPRHQGGALGDAQIELRQPHSVLVGHPVRSLDRRRSSLASVGNVMALG